ncbi:ABC transporter substrate-binding protein [Marinivivus vitaminiproducens]|uniref:ABC transporter substrate-binding protein n=1 Tax=Marinivivus vitaminiproducens TaxID=3035935 RepID=UPI0027A8A5C0|nr:ABC transporter substrate-binding protein [Geminicoccaceae bacterium SCSIO 64248]
MMRQLTRRCAARCLALAVAAPAALGLLGGTAAAQTTLRVIPQADLKNIDPIWTTAYITRNHGYLVYDTLFALDENFEPQPQMVDTYEVSEDGLTYSFVLREGLTFHDGAPVTAEDVVASLQRWGKRDAMGIQLMASTASLEAKDERTVVLTLSEPYGLVLQSLGKASSNVPFIMPKRIAETDPFTQIDEVIGSGPFKFEQAEWVPGSKVVYTKFADYKPRSEAPSFASGGKLAKVDRVEWLYIPDANTALNAMVSGEVDYWEQPPVDLLPILQSTPDLTVETTDPLGSHGVARFNHLHPPFDDVKVRQAVLMTIDQERYMQAGVGNPEYYNADCWSYYTCNSPVATDAGSEAYKGKGIEAAKALLAESGYDGEPVVLLQPVDIPVTNAAALLTAEALREIGMNVDLQAMDWATATSRRASRETPQNGGWSMFFTWWVGADVLNPLANASLKASGDDSWFGWATDARMEELRTAFAKASDPEEQKRIAVEASKQAYQFVPYGIFGHWTQPVAYNNRLNGVLKSPVPLFWNIEKAG